MYQLLGQLALTGLPIAFQALSELNRDSAPAGENLAGAGAATLGGLGLGTVGTGLGMASKQRRWLSPLLGGLGAYGGAAGGGAVGRGTARFLAPDATTQNIRDAERMARSQLTIEEERQRRALPLQRQQLELQALAAARQGQIDLASTYAAAMLQPSARISQAASGGMAPFLAALGQSALS